MKKCVRCVVIFFVIFIASFGIAEEIQTHKCEVCENVGTHEVNGITGNTEYYCDKHYKELQDMYTGLFGNTVDGDENNEIDSQPNSEVKSEEEVRKHPDNIIELMSDIRGSATKARIERIFGRNYEWTQMTSNATLMDPKTKKVTHKKTKYRFMKYENDMYMLDDYYGSVAVRFLEDEKTEALTLKEFIWELESQETLDQEYLDISQYLIKQYGSEIEENDREITDFSSTHTIKWKNRSLAYSHFLSNNSNDKYRISFSIKYNE